MVRHPSMHRTRLTCTESHFHAADRILDGRRARFGGAMDMERYRASVRVTMRGVLHVVLR